MTTTTLAYFPSPPRGVWYLGTLSALVIIAGIIAALFCISWLRDDKRRDGGGVSNLAVWAAPVVVIGLALVAAYFLAGVPRLFGIGPLPLRAYAGFILIGVVVALYIGDRRWTARGGEPGVVYDIALLTILLGLFGGRIYHVLTDWNTYFGPGGAGLWAAFQIQEGGLGIWGAVALGGVGAWIGCRRRGIPLPAFGDAIAPGIVLAQAIGRIGNYFNQELYGRSTRLPWGLEIFERRDAAGGLNPLNGVSTGQLIEVVHPTFLYELLWNLLVFALLIWVDRRFRIGHGRLFALYVAAYCFGRFWIELMRSDMATHIAGIRINSFVSVFVFIGAVVYIMVAPKGREDPSTLRGNDESPVEEVAKELAAVAATTGVVAAAKAAGEMEDEDAAEADAAERFEADVADMLEAAEEPEVEAVAEAEQLAEDVAVAPAEDIAEAEAFAEAGEQAEQAESIGGVGAVEGEDVVEAEEAASEVHEAAVEGVEEAAGAADEIAEEPAEEEPASEDSADVGEAGAEQPAEESDTEEAAEAVGGVGAVEGEDVVEAEEAASEVHEAAVEGVEEAAGAADEIAEEPAEEEPASEDSADVGEAGAEQPAEESDTEEAAEAVGGVGAVEGEDVVEAEEAASEVHEAAVEGVEEAAEAADEVADEPPDELVDTESASEESGEDEKVEAEQPDSVSEEAAEAIGGVGAVEGDELIEAEEAAPEVHETAAEGAEEAAVVADEVADESAEKTKEPADESEPAQAKEPEEVAESGNGLRGWIRSRRNR